MTKRNIFVIALAVCLAAVIACGTLAWFTAEDTTTNKFMTAKYTPDNPPTPDDIFSIVINEDGGLNGSKTDSGLTYENIKPGDELTKKVTVTNTGAYSAYVRLCVTVTKADVFKGFINTANVLASLADINSTEWTFDKTVVNEDGSETYIYYYNTAVAPEAETTALFTTVTIPGAAIDVAEMTAINGFEIKLVAEAIQSDNTGSVTEALALLNK